MLIGIIFFVLTVIVAVSIPFLVRYAEGKAYGEKKKKSKKSDEASKKKAANVKDLWEIEDIRDGVVYLTKGRCSAVLKLGAVNFHLLSEEDQYAVESALMSMATGLGFRVQFFSTTEVVDTRSAVEELRTATFSEGSEIRVRYAEVLLDYLVDLMSQRMVLTKNTYAVVTYQDPDRKKAVAKLSQFCTQLIKGLEGAKVKAVPLTSDEIVDLLYRTLNRKRPARPSDAVAAGALEYYVTKKKVEENVSAEAPTAAA